MELSPFAVDVVRSIASAHVVQHAVVLMMRNAVHILHREDLDDHVTLEAEVENVNGQGTEYVTAKVFDSHEVSFYCTCEAGGACSHLGALLLVELGTWEREAGHNPRIAPPRQPGLTRRNRWSPRSKWRQEFDALLPSESPSDFAEACVFIELASATRPSYYGGQHRSSMRLQELQIRPGMRGKRGLWIKGKARWNAVEALGLAPDASDLLQRIHRLYLAAARNEYWYYSNSEWLPLSAVPGNDIWQLLKQLGEVGVPLVSTGKQQRPVRFDTRPITIAGIVQAGDAALQVRAEARLGADAIAYEALAPIGSPAAAIAHIADKAGPSEQITLHPVATAVDALTLRLLNADEPIEVPTSERAAFETDYLPRLQASLQFESPDASVAIPEIRRTSLKLVVNHEGRRTHLDWLWDRPAGFRPDAEREAQILDRLRSAAGANQSILWPAHAPSASDGSAEQPLRIPDPNTLSGTNHVVFLTQVLPRLHDLEGVEVTEQAEPPSYREAETLPVVEVSAEADGDWFDLHVKVQVEGEAVEFADIYTALAREDALFVLPSGTYFSLEGEEFSRLRDILAEARALSDRPNRQPDDQLGDGFRLNRHQVSLWDDLAQLGVVAAREAQWWLTVQSLGEGQRVEAVAVPKGIRAELRDYQLEGMSWLHFLRTSGLGGVLADEMGLGKTLQTIAMMELAREEHPDMPPFLVVAPTSVVGNWARECEKFAPNLRVSTITSMASKRGCALSEATAGAHVVVTSYALFRGEAEEYRGLAWSGLILDEAQQIKNHASHGYRAARALDAPFTLVITGTPLENNLLEFWALVSLAAPGLLGNRQRFTEFYRTPIERDKNSERLALLQRRVQPFLLRRSKDLVAAELPPKQEQTIEVTLHPRHRKLYDVQFQRERQRLLGLIDDVNANRFQIFQSLTLLRQLALDPALVDAGHAPSGKLDALIELLTEAHEEGHRVLVLSQFTRFLGSARDRAEEAGLDWCYLDGSTTDRQQVIDEFRNGNAPVFFVSLKAGGFGLNLVEADYVVLLDPWWNPAVEEQAIDRTHRLGQHRPVFVYRLVAANTIEQKVIALRESKAELFARVLDGGGAMGESTLTANQIRELLE
ncbi:DEAD/DEAH box helicase [Gulosibacter molinativorax]|uniref:DNA/RNA helicase n=1 Tax=Gulosibacter molinativorax TaxID=256821 RepID=A0ABT7C6A7_9MICO|nr:DEAD/DEAH box helicase [Gulosibacter molinativorax]MDJ1370746.1 DNA/RNA helicase [Gulosibacter molinativorax]QUY63227.1 Putative helicase [Gulosibacter molinativorax]